MMDTVFVTGGSSTLGHHVLRSLASRVGVLATVHCRNVEIPAAEIELLHGGLEEAVRNPAPLQRAQVILHMAAVTHSENPSEYFRVNAELTKQLLSVCLPSQHFVYLSTICAHPEGGAYGRSKWLAEEAIRGSGLTYTIIRPAEIYASKSGEGIDALLKLARKIHILPDFRWRGSITYAPISVDEAAQFIAQVTMEHRSTNETYTVCAERPCTALQMAEALRSSVRPLFVVPVPIMVLRAANALRLPVPFKRDQIDRLVLPKTYNNALARRDYDFHPRCFLDNLAKGEKITVGAGSGR
jgi:nucleoside-diphosphate-sugar epimerase